MYHLTKQIISTFYLYGTFQKPDNVIPLFSLSCCLSHQTPMSLSCCHPHPSISHKSLTGNKYCISSFFSMRATLTGSWSFPGAAGQLPVPSPGRPASQPEPFSWLTFQHLQPASYTLHLQRRSSPHTRFHINEVSSTSTVTAYIMTHAFFFLPSARQQHRCPTQTLPAQPAGGQY